MTERVKLVRNAERAMGLRKQAADAGPTLALDITTPANRLQDVWDLYGDGRRIVDGTTRTLLMLKTLKDMANGSGSFALNPTLGTAKLLGQFVARYAGVASFASGPAYSEGQACAVAAMASYLDACNAAGLVEPGAAARALTEAGLPASAVAEEALYQPPAIEAWLGVADEPPEPIPTYIREKVQPRFTFLSGATVEVDAVWREVRQAFDLCEEGASIVVISPDPKRLFDALAPYIVKAGWNAGCRTRVPFRDTLLGRAVHACHLFLEGAADPRIYASDFARSPLSGMSSMQALAFDADIRSKPALAFEELANMLANASKTFQLFRRMVETPSQEAVEELKALCLSEGQLPKASMDREAAAFVDLASFFEACGAISAESEAIQFLEESSVTFSVEAFASESTRSLITFIGVDQMDSLAPASVDSVIFADMDKDAFPIPKARPATDGLLDVMGLADDRNMHEEYRSAFASACAAAKASVSFVASMRDISGSPAYPSFLFEEVVDQLADGNIAYVDSDDIFPVPKSLMRDGLVLDESAIVPGFGQTMDEAKGQLELPDAHRGSLHVQDIQSFMRMDASTGLPILSASQMERYLECPYKWFISSKVGVDDLDAKLDNLAIGSFVHEVFRVTFERLAQEGVTAVTEESLARAQQIASAAFGELLAASDGEGNPDAIIVSGIQEELQMEAVRARILDALELMVQLPEGYEFKAAELKIRPEDGIEYAGAIINGSIDRVDVSGEGIFAIIDYKGAAAGHEAGDKTMEEGELPDHVQALIYAQCLSRLPGFQDLSPAAAMYLGYKATEAKKLVAGTFDASLYDAWPLVSNKKSSAAVMQEVLDKVEHKVAESVRGMMSGDIAPDPKPGACEWCDMTFCPGRKVATDNG